MGIQTQTSPHFYQGRNHHGEAEHPGKQQHQADVARRVYLVIETVAGDENVPVGSKYTIHSCKETKMLTKIIE